MRFIAPLMMPLSVMKFSSQRAIMSTIALPTVSTSYLVTRDSRPGWISRALVLTDFPEVGRRKAASPFPAGGSLASLRCRSVLGAFHVGTVFRRDDDARAGRDVRRHQRAHAVRQDRRLVGGGSRLALDDRFGLRDLEGDVARQVDRDGDAFMHRQDD